jgi:hypothetical protein
MDIRRKWNAFVGWCLYYPLGGLNKIREKASKYVFGVYTPRYALYYNTYHEYLVRNATKALTKQVEAKKPKDPTKKGKLVIINRQPRDKKEQNKA